MYIHEIKKKKKTLAEAMFNFLKLPHIHITYLMSLRLPLEKERQPTPVFLPGESHRQRNLAGCSPWRRTESDMTEVM